MIQGKSVQRCNGLGGNRTHYGRPLAAPGRKESVREDKFIKGERVDKCKEGERGGLKNRSWRQGTSPTSKSCGPQSRSGQVRDAVENEAEGIR